MLLKLKRFDEGIWFDSPYGGRFKLRPIPPRRYLELRDEMKRKIAVSKPDGGFEIIDDYPEGMIMVKMLDYILEDWQDVEVEGVTGKEDVKNHIISNPDLQNWIIDQSGKISTRLQGQFEDELKNSSSSQSG